MSLVKPWCSSVPRIAAAIAEKGTSLIRQPPFDCALCRVATRLSWQPVPPCGLRDRVTRGTGMGMFSTEIAPDQPMPVLAAFRAGFMATWSSVFAYVLFGNYLGIGAISHDFGFDIAWTLVATVLVWAGPAQVILVSTLGTGASLFEVALAVGLSGVRLLPMVVSMLPMLKRPDARSWKLVMPAHFT